MAAEVVLVPALQQPNNSGQVRVTDATEWCSRPLHVPVTGRADGEGIHCFMHVGCRFSQDEMEWMLRLLR